MDINLFKTFLEIARSGSFIGASERLNVTQTTVTARIKNLEEYLGCKLFIRNKSGAKLTDNGRRFISHASQMVQTWESAKRDLPLPDGTQGLLALGGEMSLWNPLFLNWLTAIRTDFPYLAIRSQVSDARRLHDQLEAGVMDAALVHKPDYWPGMQVLEILEEKLVFVRSRKTSDPYIFVDWGEDFRLQHDTVLPDQAKSDMTINLGPLALLYLLEHGGSGYFRTRVVQKYIDDGLLELVPQSPEFSYPIYLVYPKNKYNDVLERVIRLLREAARTSANWSQHQEREAGR
jgi:DNA-binding transcriptional LysR family regulator